MTSAQFDYTALTDVITDLEQLLEAARSAQAQWEAKIARVDKSNRASARNLAQYWAVRQHDLRELQPRLSRFGLSSLGRSEAHVLATLEATTVAADALFDYGGDTASPALGFEDGARLLRRRTAELFGPTPEGRSTRIMVTLPSEAADDDSLVPSLIAKGMNLARINCAHDDPTAWASMIDRVRQSSAAQGVECRVVMDVAGPKLRTGPLAPGPRVIRLRPSRDPLGRVTEPARCRLVASGAESDDPTDGLTAIPVPSSWLSLLKPGDTVTLRDTRDAHRRLEILATDAQGALATLRETTYIGTATILRAPDGSLTGVGELPPVQRYLTLYRGDDLILTRDCSPAPVAPGGPPRIGCTLAEAFDHIRVGDAVHFDDGRIGGVVTAVGEESTTVRVLAAAAKGSRLRAGKGINLPDTYLPIPALTELDRSHLPFIAAHADIVELSFARSARDIEDVLSALDGLDADHLGVVVKVETAQGFANLPDILFTAMRRAHTGVMIARGDLAVECGYERVAELQEEILWLCEAAHLPVIWATQVLDHLARSGLPSRAEITDAAMGSRAECVMLNKGPHILEALISLDDILTRMTGHHEKKAALMRPLRSWRSGPAAAPLTSAPLGGPARRGAAAEACSPRDGERSG